MSSSIESPAVHPDVAAEPHKVKSKPHQGLKPHFTQIYFALDTDADRVKIGRTQRYLSSRLTKVRLDAGLPVGSLRLMYAFATMDQTAEGSIHKLLREYRIDGEWFMNGPHILIAVELWLKNGPAVEHLRIVGDLILSRFTGELVGEFVPKFGVKTTEELVRKALNIKLPFSKLRAHSRRILQLRTKLA